MITTLVCIAFAWLSPLAVLAILVRNAPIVEDDTK